MKFYELIELAAQMGQALMPVLGAIGLFWAFKINLSLQEIRATQRKTRKEFVYPRVVELYRNFESDIIRHGVAGFDARRCERFQQALLDLDEHIERLASQSDADMQLWPHWTAFRAKFGELLRTLIEREADSAELSKFKKGPLQEPLYNLLMHLMPSDEFNNFKKNTEKRSLNKGDSTTQNNPIDTGYVEGRLMRRK